MKLARLVLREYLRVSKDDSGREKSPKQQHADHVKDADREGFTLHKDPYGDVGSASRFARKEREDYLRLVADLREGTFGADGICLWESSRGSRKVSEWALLIELLHELGKYVWVHTHGRLYDMRNARDRRTLQEEAVDAEYESSKASDRIKRDAADHAAEGGASGRVSYGYRRVFDPKTGELLGREKDPEKAEHVTTLLFEPFVAGKSLQELERLWAKKGLTNGVGNPMQAEQLRQMLRNRQYIGERVHLPGRQARWWVYPEEVRITSAKWPAIVDRETFFKAQKILEDPSRKTTRPGRGIHELSLIARCDVCSSRLTAGTKRGKPTYRCDAKGCVTVRRFELDDVARERIFAYLSSPIVFKGLQQSGEDDGAELRAVREQLAEAEAEHAKLKAAGKALKVSIDYVIEVEPAMVERITRLRARRDELQVPSALHGWVGPRADVEARWNAASTQVHRGVSKLVLTPEHAGELRVTRSPIAGRAAAQCPVEDRVVFLRST